MGCWVAARRAQGGVRTALAAWIATVRGHSAGGVAQGLSLGHPHSQRLACGGDPSGRWGTGLVASELRGYRPEGHRTKLFVMEDAKVWPDAAEWSSALGLGLTYGLSPVQVVDSGTLEVGGEFER